MIGIENIDLSLYSKEEGMTKTTFVYDNPILNNPRVYLKKIEQIYHRSHTSSYINVIIVEKYFDDKLIKSYSWIEEADYDELLLNFKTTKKFRKHKQYTERKDYYKQYYEQHKNQPTTPKNEYSKMTEEEAKQARREYAKQYYLEHTKEIKERKRQYYLKHKKI